LAMAITRGRNRCLYAATASPNCSFEELSEDSDVAKDARDIIDVVAEAKQRLFHCQACGKKGWSKVSNKCTLCGTTLEQLKAKLISEATALKKALTPPNLAEQQRAIVGTEGLETIKSWDLTLCELCGKKGWSNKEHKCTLCGKGVADVVRSKLLKTPPRKPTGVEFDVDKTNALLNDVIDEKPVMALPTAFDDGFGDGYMKYSKKDTRTPVEKAQGLAEFKDVLSTVRDDKGAGIAETYLQCIECGTFQWSKKQAKCLHCGTTQAQLIQNKIREQAMKRAETAPKDPEMDKVKDAVLGTQKAEEAMNQQMDEDLKNAFF